MVNSKGRASTQRVEPKLALVEIEMPNGAFDEGWEPTVDSYMGILVILSHLFIPFFCIYCKAVSYYVTQWTVTFFTILPVV